MIVKDDTKFIVLALIDIKIDGKLPVCLNVLLWDAAVFLPVSCFCLEISLKSETERSLKISLIYN
jgi:hypothetical protein